MGDKILVFKKFGMRLVRDDQNIRNIPLACLWQLVMMTFLAAAVTACQPAPRTFQTIPPVEATSITPTRTIPTSTIQATSTTTQTPQAVHETEAAQAILKATEEASVKATAKAIAPILDELPVYNASPSYGHVGAIYEPITLTVDGFHAGKSTNEIGALSVKDFLVAANITWDSKYGNAGCGFTFRSDANKDAPNEYRVVLSRISGGRIYFYTLANGKIANFRDFYAIPYDPYFKWENGTTNRLTVGVKGNKVYIFTNQILVGALDITDPPPDSPILPEKPIKPIPPGSELTGKDLKEAQHAYKLEMEEYLKANKKYAEEVAKIYADYNAILAAYSSNNTVYDEGTVGLLAYSISGYVNCQFNNAWLWVLK